MSASGTVCPKLMNGLQGMVDLGAGMILLNEINCDVKRSDIRDTYKTHLDKHWLHSRTEFTCSTVKPQNTYLPGGSLISALGHWTGRVINTEVDSTKMERWTCYNMRGKKSKIVSIYSAYRVPQDSLPGDQTTYAQQYKMMQDAGHLDPRPRRQFITDLIADIKAKQADQNHQIILGLDANEILEADGTPVKSSSIIHLKRECGLTDVYEFQHEVVGDTSSKKRHKIDHLLVSPDVLPSVVRSGFLPWGTVIESDHRTGFVDFDATLLFGQETSDSTSLSARKLHTKYAKRVLKYREEVLGAFKARGLFKSMRRLQHRAHRCGRWTPKM